MGKKLVTALSSAIGNNGITTGSIDGFVISYNDTDTINISSGTVEANGASYSLDADTTHDMTSLASAFDHHYIYIDDDASTAPTAIIIDSTTEPAWSDSKNGYYNGDDRCIGSVVSTDGAATLIAFVTSGSGKLITIEMPVNRIPQMANNLAADGTWKTPNLFDGDVVTPVSATKIRIGQVNTDAGSNVYLYMSCKEVADIETSINNAQGQFWAGSVLYITASLILGVSRQVRFASASNDDNAMDVRCLGYTYKR